MTPIERILRAGIHVFCRTGYRRSSMSQVAEAAGLTRQALYHHFTTKEELFKEVIARAHRAGLETAKIAGDECERGGGRLADVLSAQVTAPLKVILEGLSGSPHIEELFSRQLIIGCDPYLEFAEQHAALRAATMNRFRRVEDLEFAQGMTAAGLADCIAMSVEGVRAAYPSMQPSDAFLRQVEIIVRTLVAGAFRAGEGSAMEKPSVGSGKTRRRA